MNDRDWGRLQQLGGVVWLRQYLRKKEDMVATLAARNRAMQAQRNAGVSLVAIAFKFNVGRTTVLRCTTPSPYWVEKRKKEKEDDV